MQIKKWNGRGRLPLPRFAVALALSAAALTGCSPDEILDVQDPDIVDPNAFTDETSLPAIRAAVVGDFHLAYLGNDGGTEGQILTSGLLGDEWFHSGTFPTRSEVDIRNIEINNGTVQSVTRNLYRARSTAERAIDIFERLGANTAGHAEVLNLAGFTYVLFGENYCSGVPFSEFDPQTGSFTFGGQETTEQIFTRALERADAALQAAMEAENNTQTNVARILRGRALLNLGRFEEAAAAVETVPTSFVYEIESSDNTGREQNGVFVFNVISERWSVADNEGENGLPYRSADDPRVRWRRTGSDVGFDRTTPQYDQLKYPGRDAPTPVATGVEARLIEAEAALNRGDMLAFRTHLNDARVQDGVDPLTLTDIPVDQRSRVDLLFRERAFALWLTSHRLGDMRRLLRQYDELGYTEDNVFPTGEYHKNVQGGVYGDDVNLPISIDERNNPEFSQFPSNQDLCLNRDP